MTGSPSSREQISRAVVTGGVLVVLLWAILAVPSAARTSIQTIQNGDMIFIYEQNLDITALRTGANPVASLRKYQDDDPTKALLREVAVSDDTSFSLIPEEFGDLRGVYIAFNPAVGAMGRVVVQLPSVSIDAVLASPNHVDSIAGLTIPEDTPIAFKITSVDVGSTYHAGSLFPATVDLVLTAPGGAQLTTILGRDFSAMHVSRQVFYTDDPGRPGAISLGSLGAGSYSVQAKWRDPASFENQAPDSNIITFTIGKKIAVQTTPTPVTTPVTTQTTATTVRQTIPPTTTRPVTTVGTPTPEATTLPPATGTTSPPPTPAPTGAWLAFLAPAMAALTLILKRRKG
ncbi:MAG TPA: DUF3821 domain-containing protein [Methanomicrobiales archaeon]|nr:DUF3821 domain-containing protein [Methanomicrobiales archaeon]